MRILFIAPNRIGDAVVASGLLDHLVSTHPEARFTVACGTPAGGVFQRMPNLESLILVEKRPRNMHWLTLWRQVVRRRWDLVVDIKGSALGYLVWARRRAVFRGGRGRMFEQYAAALGVSPAPRPVAWTAAADRDKAEMLLGDGPIIALGPTANWDGKVWPAPRFAALVQRLRAEALPGARVAVFGGPGGRERAMAAPLLAALPDATDLCGTLTLAEATACIARCSVYVGNDSGLMHLAAATGTPTVGLCGATMDTAVAMEPAGLRARWAMASGPSMDALTVETVMAACHDMLR